MQVLAADQLNLDLRAGWSMKGKHQPGQTSMKGSPSAATRALWAKSGDGSGHPLVAHLLDVAASAWAILEREPGRTRTLFGDDLHLDPDAGQRWICALAGLHDLGKASPAFQQKWRPGADQVRAHGLTWSERNPPSQGISHGCVTQWALEELLRKVGWSFRAAQQAADAVGAHHGFRATSDQLDIGRRDRGGEPWDRARLELLQTVVSTLETAETAPEIDILSGSAFMRLAGLTSFADWIGSSLPFAPLGSSPRQYFADALGRARSRLDSIGWHKRVALADDPPPMDELFAYLGRSGKPFRARPLQITVEDLLDVVSAPTLLLVEAPTGEGKTEAAFHAHVALQAALGHRGMYVALPTQATGNMMFTRTKRFLEQVGAEKHLDLQLLHGAALLNKRFQSIVVREAVPEDAQQAVAAREWFTHRKRALLSEYGVGTVDQALLSVLNVKHQFVRLWGLANRTVVIDEVHAYDTYTSGLITGLIRWLHALGSSVIVMSATLPSASRRELMAAFGATDFADAPYPRITRVSSGRSEARTFRTRQQPAICLRAVSADVHNLAHLLSELATRGGCVACIVNTVQRAQDLYRLMAPSGIPLWLFHARYPAAERQRIEEEVTQLFGLDPACRPGQAVLIATQVVEQSLDLDFDVMVTDIAPIDLLLQRAGRLHRHDRSAKARQGHAKPVLHIAGMQHDAELPNLAAPYYFDSIYERYVLLRTWLVLRSTDSVTPPEDVDRLVQLVYGGDRLEDTLNDSMRQAFCEARAAMDKDTERDQADAHAVVIGNPYDRTWEEVRGIRRQEDDEEGRFLPAVTRKGSESVTAIPLYSVHGGYALDVEGARPVSLDETPSFEQAKATSMCAVRLSRYGVVRGLKSQDVSHSGWRKSPLLHDCHPLVLDGERNVFGNVRVSCTPELGIEYEKLTE